MRKKPDESHRRQGREDLIVQIQLRTKKWEKGTEEECERQLNWSCQWWRRVECCEL